ncbi:nitrogen regulatory protein PII [Desulfitobacterium dichloroeliminans LMG P-21439]|uniref:Nitrogen regulatory protein PII n=1 Tax=Desulfitobacterium dichloroeliminans (strain LMG P-21439 / DCA1) TaxID=871963 RepID=L0F5W9_DESDL|nr:P-II family nitrogen regulator [Desulfitobacterium dichloroeliminans]AGA68440.1 nitrogen regulatory protein PII [Desulfitobacterium dichloroeliminans LMG P-21439]
MKDSPTTLEFELISLVVNHGVGTKVLKFAKQHGISGGTICLGRGTVNNPILKLLDLTDIRKEIVMMIGEKKAAENALAALNEKLALHKPNHGIAFISSVRGFVGHHHSYRHEDESRGAENPMYNAIYTVVDRGMAEDVMEAATKAGSRGGTIINARGSGIHETNTLFSMAIEPEKEIVMILAESSTTEAIITAIRQELHIDNPGHGIIFVLDVNRTYGLRQ